MKRPAIVPAALVLALAGCTTEHVTKTQVVKGTAIDHGKALFSDHESSPSATNTFSCATCHLSEAMDDGRILPGAALGGAVDRPTFWGGQENDLLRAINDCRFYFMDAPKPWKADDEDAKAIYAYLSSLPKDTAAAPFTVTKAATDVATGDANVGADVFARACAACHGALHTGKGRLAALAPRLPDDASPSLAAANRRVIFVEKVRHGTFLGYGGIMPPFSEETLDDDQIAGLLAYFALY
ncbi:MAG TPA: c-type cytochrome [Methyloceanibacter sp.]|nr:c-type cytochrome [Methyloceanibacter sp.]